MGARDCRCLWCFMFSAVKFHGCYRSVSSTFIYCPLWSDNHVGRANLCFLVPHLLSQRFLRNPGIPFGRLESLKFEPTQQLTFAQFLVSVDSILSIPFAGVPLSFYQVATLLGFPSFIPLGLKKITKGFPMVSFVPFVIRTNPPFVSSCRFSFL